MLSKFRAFTDTKLKFMVYITVLAFSLATFSQLAETSILRLERHVLSSHDSKLSLVEKRKNSSKETLDFSTTLQREALTSKRSNNAKIGFFIGSGAALLDSFSGKLENTTDTDEASRLTGFTVPTLSRSPPLTV